MWLLRWKTGSLDFAFSSCNVFFHPFKVQGAELIFRNFSEITNRSHWTVLFCLLLQRKTTDKGVQTKLREAKKETTGFIFLVRAYV